MLARKIRLGMVVAKKKNGVDDVDPDKDEWLSAIKPQITAIGGIALAPSIDAGHAAHLETSGLSLPPLLFLGVLSGFLNSVFRQKKT